MRYPNALAVAAILMATTSALPSMARAETTAEEAETGGLADIVVVARKKEESLQQTPLAIAVLNDDALEQRGINSLNDFITSPSPFLQISPFAGSGVLPIIGIRGLATDDPGQGSNESAVGIYMDGVYLGRAQGASMEFGDVAQIEVLRGPQGTLFGRNALGGAVNIISKKPTGELGFEQELTYGSFNEFRSLSHLNLPAFGRLKIKGDFLFARRDGWVKNADRRYKDFGAYERVGGRIAANLEVSDTVTADYVFDISDDRSTLGYIQRLNKTGQIDLPAEPDRVRRSQIPTPVDYSRSKTTGHALTLTYAPSDSFKLKSISAYRTMEYRNRDFFPGIFINIPTSATTLLLGNVSPQNDKQHQFSQELQATGDLKGTAIGSVSYAVGLYYFEESVDSEFKLGTGSYILGPGSVTDPANLTLADPAVALLRDPASRSEIRSKSYAGYAQVSIRPPIFDETVELTAGVRYTHDDKTGRQLIFNMAPSNNAFRLKSNSFDHNISLAWSPVPEVNLYVRNATGYRAGGVSLRDPGFVPFRPDDTNSWELGLKSEFLNRRARFNVALFDTRFNNMRTSFSDPALPSVTRLFNAQDTVKIRGAEAELTLAPVDGVVLSGSYSYLDTKVPPQKNPFNTTIVQGFALAQAPEHSASFTADWTVGRFDVGTLTVHGDAYFTSAMVNVPQLVGSGSPYELYNARITLSDIPLGGLKAKAAVWVKNLTDAKYIPWEMAWIGATETTRLIQYGNPRTVGATIGFEF